MNWGNKILALYLVFVAGIVLMVVKSSSQKTDLVTNDYYEKELKYQDKIDEMGRVTALTAPVKFDIKAGVMRIEFPADFAGKKLDGEVVLYYPADEKKDFKKSFSLIDNMLKVDIPAANRGLHQIQLSWSDGKATYYFEKKIFI